MECQITIVIPQRGQSALTIAAIRSLRSWEDESSRVIVVDDGSGDDSVGNIRREGFPNCDVLEQPPRGVTAAWNAGIHHATSEYMVLLNNDVMIDGPFLERLIRPLRNRQAWIVGAEWRNEPQAPVSRLLTGWCLAFERSLWERLGGFDERFRLYWSDTDFQCRAACENPKSGFAIPVRALTNRDSLPPADSPEKRNPVIKAEPGFFPVLRAVPELPLRHLGHRTARHDPQRTKWWHADREAFVHKWNV